MPIPKIILVPTDFGEPSEAALDTAIAYARVFGSEIVLMHAFEIPIVGFPDGAMTATAPLTSRILEGAQVGLDRQIKAREGCGVVIRGMIKQGDAYHMVNETAEEVSAGLIAIGTHGRKGLSRALIGSVAEKVVRSATVPVLAVHADDVVKAEVSPATSREAPTAPTSGRPASNGRAIEEAPASHR